MGRIGLACLLLLGLGGSIPAAAAKDLTAAVLVARTGLPDPSFRDAVVLVMNNLGPAPAGLVLNRPTRLTVARLFPDEAGVAHSEQRLYFGGPVDLGTVSFLFRAPSPPEHAVEVLDGVYLSTDRELLRGLLARERPMEGLRVFIGYAGWGPAQLEAEIARGDWTLAPADASAIFEPRAEHPWPDDPTPEGMRRI